MGIRKDPSLQVWRFRFLCLAVCWWTSIQSIFSQEEIGKHDRLDTEFAKYWEAINAANAQEIVQRIIGLDPNFEGVYARLKRGRHYSSEVPRGKLIRTHEIRGVPHPYMIFIPEDYDASRAWPVRWDLHGGMGQSEWKTLDGSWSPGWAAIQRYESDLITVIPAGWWDSMWWEGSQVDNFQTIMEEVKRIWNIDENQVFVFGSSDGAIGAWFYAFRYADPWAYYIGYVGFPARLTNRSMRADGQMHLSNLFQQKFYLRNGVHDRIVNIDVMRKYLEVIRKVDVQINYAEHAEDGHDLTLTREEELEPFRHFLRVRRDPLPERVAWATERTDRYNRRFWLIIEELESDHSVDKSNILPRIYGKNVPRTRPPKARPWRRVELERIGNRIRATTIGVRSFRLLFSPNEFDFSQPIAIEVNSQVVFDAKVEPDLDTLFEWAIRDNDRQMLFAAELVVQVP